MSIVPCSIPECSKPHLARGWCRMHYLRWHKHGDPLYTPTVPSPTTCSVETCSQVASRLGFCNAHYLRNRRHGDPLAGGTSKVGDADAKFHARTVRRGGCLVWTAGRKSSGYGKMTVDGATVPVHRWAYERFVGPIPKGMEIDHMCHNRLCCEPTHLRVVTHKENAENHQGSLVTSKTGVRGVWRRDSDGKFVVEVKHHKRKHHGGFFEDLAAAEQAAIELRNRLFTHNDVDRVS